jgi:hypothetical protein
MTFCTAAWGRHGQRGRKTGGRETGKHGSLDGKIDRGVDGDPPPTIGRVETGCGVGEREPSDGLDQCPAQQFPSLKHTPLRGHAQSDSKEPLNLHTYIAKVRALLRVSQNELEITFEQGRKALGTWVPSP